MDIELLIMVTVITSKGLGKFCYKKKNIFFRRHVGTGISRTKAIIGYKNAWELDQYAF